jgi:hypothetical protein
VKNVSTKGVKSINYIENEECLYRGMKSVSTEKVKSVSTDRLKSSSIEE